MYLPFFGTHNLESKQFCTVYTMTIASKRGAKYLSAGEVDLDRLRGRLRDVGFKSSV